MKKKDEAMSDQELLSDIASLALSSSGEAISAHHSIKMLEQEVKRLKYENSVLVSTETLLESKCAALDSRLEEALATIAHKDHEIEEKRRLLKQAQIKEREYEKQIKGLALAVDRHEQVARQQQDSLKDMGNELTMQRERTRQFDEQGDALEAQIRATSETCLENARLEDELAEMRRRLARLEDENDQLLSSRDKLGEKDLYIASLEARVDKLNEQVQAATDLKHSVNSKQQQELQELAKEKDELKAKLADSEMMLERLGKELQMEHSQVLELKLSLQESHGELKTGQTRINDLEREQYRLQSEMAIRSDKLETLQQSLREKDRQLEKMDQEFQLEKRVMKETFETERISTRRELEETSFLLEKSEKRLQQEKRKNLELEASLDTLEASFHSTLTENKKTIVSRNKENEMLRNSLLEFEQMISSSNSSSKTTNFHDNNRPKTPIRDPYLRDDNDDFDDPSSILAKSSQVLYFRKLRHATSSASSSGRRPNSTTAKLSVHDL